MVGPGRLADRKTAARHRPHRLSCRSVRTALTAVRPEGCIDLDQAKSGNKCFSRSHSLRPCHAPRVMRPRVMLPRVMLPRVMRPRVMRPRVMRPRVMRPRVMRPRVMRPRVMRPRVMLPAKAGHPRLCRVQQRKVVGGRPSPAMTRNFAASRLAHLFARAPLLHAGERDQHAGQQPKHQADRDHASDLADDHARRWAGCAVVHVQGEIGLLRMREAKRTIANVAHDPLHRL